MSCFHVFFRPNFSFPLRQTQEEERVRQHGKICAAAVTSAEIFGLFRIQAVGKSQLRIKK